MAKSLKAIIFDLDGTLINSHSLHLETFKQPLIKRGHKFKKRDLHRSFGKRASDILKMNYSELSNKEVEEIIKEKNELFQKRISKIKVMKCANKVLRELSKEYLLGLGSGSNKELLYRVLKDKGWNKYFKAVISSEDISSSKPSPLIINKILKKLKVNHKEAVYVGDGIYDALCARNAGVKFIGVTTGGLQKERLQKERF